jgi:hypothetical protein
VTDNRHIASSASQAWDGIASLGNLNHWGCWVAGLEAQIAERSEDKRALDGAPNYVAWLLMSAEHLTYRLRWHFYADGCFGDGKVFDARYSDLLERCGAVMNEPVLSDAEFVINVRHVIVHKGFPNPQAAPMQREDAGVFLMVRDVIKEPRNYEAVRARFRAVHDWLRQVTPSVTFGIN